jgi:hypothetical protein
VLQTRISIAFDFDGTLLSGNTALQEYVRQHHQRMRFLIVTHRSRRETATIPQELEQIGLSIDMFERIVGCPERVIMGFEEAQQMRRSARLPRAAEAENLFPDEIAFVNWKGQTARKLRCHVLVDDIPWLAEPGCRDNGVKFIRADEFPKGAPLAERLNLPKPPLGRRLV